MQKEIFNLNILISKDKSNSEILLHITLDGYNLLTKKCFNECEAINKAHYYIKNNFPRFQNLINPPLVNGKPYKE